MQPILTDRATVDACRTDADHRCAVRCMDEVIPVPSNPSGRVPPSP